MHCLLSWNHVIYHHVASYFKKKKAVCIISNCRKQRHDNIKWQIIITTYPELYKEESILGPFLIKLFEPTLLLRELVVDLPNVHSLKERIAVGGIGLSDVDEQVFAVLYWTETEQMINVGYRTWFSTGSTNKKQLKHSPQTSALEREWCKLSGQCKWA